MSTFRKAYKQLTPEQAQAIEDIKSYAESLEEAITYSVPVGRFHALAMTKLEEAVMWAVKGITG